ncbi:MAG TPA: hypothetical protein VGE07_00100 [Herpetosiphonaceae bacterium]
MGETHSVLPLLDDPAFAPWLAAHGIVLPPPWPPSRYPTPHEIRTVLDQAPDYQVQYAIGTTWWDADVQAPAGWTTIWVQEFTGDETVPLPFFFRKGEPAVNLWILAQLTPWCGPLVMVSSSEVLPILVTADQQIIYGQEPGTDPPLPVEERASAPPGKPADPTDGAVQETRETGG